MFYAAEEVGLEPTSPCGHRILSAAECQLSDSSPPMMWTRGESNPELIHAMDTCCHYTTGPYFN